MEKENVSKNYSRKALTAFLTVLLISSAVLLIASMNVTTVKAENSISLGPYGDINSENYSYPIGPGGNSGNNFFNAGPGPNTPTIKYAVTAANLGLTGTLSGAPCIAADGKIILYTSAATSGWVAINPQTGALVWNNTAMQGTPRGFGTATMFQTDATHFAEESGSGIYIYSLRDGSKTGSYANNGTTPGLGSFGGGSVIYWGGFYSSWDMMKYSTAQSTPGNYTDPDTGQILQAPAHVAVAIDCSNPAAPKLGWTRPLPTGIESLGSAPGVAYFGGYGEGQIWALNASTGKIMWTAYKGGNAGYIGNYYEGRFYHSASSTQITCFNATTGEKLFAQDEGGRAFFVFGDTLAYGMYLGKNIAVPNGYVGAWDAYTGTPLWRTPALYNIAYLTPVTADGKVYVERYSGTAGGETSFGNSFACFDAFTGNILWQLPGISWATPIIAYGNLYAVSGGTVYCIGDQHSSNSAPATYPQFHYCNDPNNYGGVLTGVPAPTNLNTPFFTYNVPDEASIGGSAVADNGKVFFGTYDGHIYAVDSNTGAYIWNFSTHYKMASTPAIYSAANLLITGADDGNIYGLDENTGALRWTTAAGGFTKLFVTPAWQGRSSPQVDNGKVFVASLDGNLYCLNAQNGQVVWTKPVGTIRYPACGTPLVVNSTYIYIVSLQGQLYNYRIADGALMFNVTIGSAGTSMMSTPVYDRGFLWTGSGTAFVYRINATDGGLASAIRLPYSVGGTMTPAICAPAVWHTGTTYALFIGDGFQEDCFNISNFRYGYNGTDGSNYGRSINITRSVGTTGFGGITYKDPTRGNQYFAANASFQNVEFQNTTAGASWTLSNGTVLSGTVYGNETNLPINWARWLGHQIYSGSLYVNDLQGAKMYLGDDVFSITCINASITPVGATNGALSGQTISAFATFGPVFGGPCIYNDTVYFGSEDGILFAFRDPPITEDFTIFATASKYNVMWNNETITIGGRLWATPKTYLDDRGRQTNLGIYASDSLVNATVQIEIIHPDGVTSDSIMVTTGNDGGFVTSYQPTQVGNYSWLAVYNGEDRGYIIYNPAYTAYTTIDVQAAPGTEPTIAPTETPAPTVAPTEAPTATPSAEVTATPTATEAPVDNTSMYIYAVVAVIVIVVIAVAAYMYMKRGKAKKE
jgi:outer membrane protein assembly factor BamB